MLKRFNILAALVAAIMVVAGVAIAGHVQTTGTSVSPLLYFADETAAGGTSAVTASRGGDVWAAVEADNLIPGNAHTVWWVVFNSPADCLVAYECGEADIFSDPGVPNEAQIDAAGIKIGNMTGGLAKADGSAEFGGHLGLDEDDGHQVIIGEQPMLTDVGAEIHLIIQDHGNARGGKKLLEQITYFEANCTPTCVDPQFSVHRFTGH